MTKTQRDVILAFKVRQSIPSLSTRYMMGERVSGSLW